jgi:hypothetical protein
MSWTFIRQGEVKARKIHRCFCCGEDIAINEKYTERVGSNDGIVVMKMHKECQEESDKWDADDWETFGMYEMDRPLTNEVTK